MAVLLIIVFSEGTTGATFGSFEHNHEPWRAKIYLRGHQSGNRDSKGENARRAMLSLEIDVQDLAWSRDNKYLASCGVDGAVIVWDGTSFGKRRSCKRAAIYAW